MIQEMNMMVNISVVIPVYGCREAVRPLCSRLQKALSKLVENYEIILVDDCCPQNSWEEIQAVCVEDKHIKGIRLSRNFGQMRAIAAGVHSAAGDWVVVMDCDLQDRPEAIEELYHKAQEGYDVVFVRRLKRKENAITMFFSNGFYRVYNYFTDGNYDRALSNFSIASRQVIDQFCAMQEQTRAYILFLKWLGFKQGVIEIESAPRAAGKSSYNFKKKLSMALELITAQSNKPLLLSVKMGFLIALTSFLYMLFLVLQVFFGAGILPGWTSMVASIYLMGGLLLMALGVLGIYMGNIFTETKHRPLYVIKTKLNMETEES